MATGRQVLKAVMTFAGNSGVFTTPSGPDDDIKPTLASLADSVFVHAWQDFHMSLRSQGIETEIPLNEMRTQAKSWRDLSNLAFDNQET